MGLATTLAGRLGCTTMTFGCGLTEKLQAMRQAGFVATEFFPRDLYEDPRGPDYAVQALRDSGLAISAYQALRDYEGMPTAQRDHVLGIAEQMMDQMAWLGAEMLVLCANVNPQASADHGRCVEDLIRLADLARSRGLRVAYEPIGWASRFADYRDAYALIDAANHPSLGLLLDSLHVGLRPMQAINGFEVEKIFLVELCDWPQTQLPAFEIARHYRLFPGEGVAPMQEFIDRLEAIGYAGTYSIEVMNDHYRHDDPLRVARRGFAAAMRLVATD